MNGRVFINRTDHAEGFVKIGNGMAQDYDTLSASAFGWLVRILSRPPTWALNLESLRCKHHGRDSIRNSMMELRRAGYVVACTRRTHGRFATVEYHVFDSPRSLAQISAICAQTGTIFNPPDEVVETSAAEHGSGTVVGLPGAGDPDAIKTETYKDGVVCSSFSKENEPAADATGVIDGDHYGLNPGDLAAATEGAMECEETTPAHTPASSPSQAQNVAHAQAEGLPLALQSEDEPDGKTFPWRQLMSTVKRIVPQVVMPTAGARRDHVMKQFWRKHGKTVGCFELLAEKVAASDYLMARGGHTGNNGRPYSWGWIFSKSDKGLLRADEIMTGGYSTESMAWILEKKAKAAAPKLTKVYLHGSSNPKEVCLTEKLTGEFAHIDRYQRIEGETKSGLPVYLDHSITS